MHLRLRGPAGAVSVRAMLRRLLRPSLALVLLTTASVAGTSGCKKAPDAGTAGPGGTGAGPTQAGGTVLRYKTAPTKLKETIKVTFTLSGQQSGEFKVDATGLLDVSDAGNGKLRLNYSVLEVRQLDATGAVKPQPKDGQPAPDLKAELLAGKGAKIIDLMGEIDEDATKALPENAKKAAEKDKEKEGEGGGFGGNLASFLGLPSGLPTEGLTPGTPWKTKKEEKENLGPIAVDMEVDLTYTLVKIDNSSGKRLAELKIESEASGAKELSQGGQNMMISIDSNAESTIVFNLDDQIPVSAHIEVTQAGSYGNFGSGETRIVIDASYEPAA